MSKGLRTIIDCYTDEPAGLGVPPFLGTYPRLVAGWFKEESVYLTIDDVRLASIPVKIKQRTFDPPHTQTRNDLINHTRPQQEAQEILKATEVFYIICGVQTPGKYLRAVPGTLEEIATLLKPYAGRKILTGPAALHGSQFRGGTKAEQAQDFDFDEIIPVQYDHYNEFQEWMVRGAGIVKQIPWQVIAELETGRGCPRDPGCSFCTEPLKGQVRWRAADLVEREAATLMEQGVRWMRLGKQSCIFSYMGGDESKIEDLLRRMRRLNPELLHIDNVNPAMVTEARTELFCRYLTPGSTAAMGAESFDEGVCKLNNLNSVPATTLQAVRIINKYGSQMDPMGRYMLLPGINIILGLDGESQETLNRNFEALKAMYDEGLLIRRINIRQVVPFPGTALYMQAGSRFLKKNRSLYVDWSKQIRHEIDIPMLRRLYPTGTILRGLISEGHIGHLTYGRQIGSYPIIASVNERLKLGQWFDIEVIDHKPRSLVGKVLEDKVRIDIGS